MKKILVPTDFSPSARNASTYAASLASAFQVEVKLLNAHMEPVPVTESFVEAPLVFPPLQYEMENHMYKEVADIESKFDIDISGEAIIGFPGDSIVQTADEIQADLIIMGREAKKKNIIFGSTIVKTIRKTHTPVLIIPDGLSFQPPKRIILAVDFTEIVYSPTFEVLQQIVKKFDSALTVLHIENENKRFDAKEISAKMQLELALSKMSYYYENVEDEDIHRGILDFVDRYPADMLVMIAHHHNFLERILQGSYTADLNFEINLPLLILKN